MNTFEQEFAEIQNKRKENIFKSFVGSEDDIEKAKSGVYKDTSENRKLGRVGQKYGGEKKQESKEEKTKKLDYQAEKLMDRLQTMRSEYKDINKVTVQATPKGNWRLYYNNKDAGITIPRESLGENTIEKYGLRQHEGEQGSKKDDIDYELQKPQVVKELNSYSGISEKELKLLHPDTRKQLYNQYLVNKRYNQLIKKELFRKEVKDIPKEDADLLNQIATKDNAIKNKNQLTDFLTGYFGQKSKAIEFVNKYNPF